jgi:hypothetical protein
MDSAQEYHSDIIVNIGRMNKGHDHLSRLEDGKEPTSLEDAQLCWVCAIFFACVCVWAC